MKAHMQTQIHVCTQRSTCTHGSTQIHIQNIYMMHICHKQACRHSDVHMCPHACMQTPASTGNPLASPCGLISPVPALSPALQCWNSSPLKSDALILTPVFSASSPSPPRQPSCVQDTPGSGHGDQSLPSPPRSTCDISQVITHHHTQAGICLSDHRHPEAPTAPALPGVGTRSRNPSGHCVGSQRGK